MNVLLVTTADNLSEKFNALNPEIEYCAIVVDSVEPAKEILSNIGLSPDLLRPMSALKTCIETLGYDYVLLVQDKFYATATVKKLQSFGLPTEKLISFACLSNAGNWEMEGLLRCYREHVQEFEIFATGTSPIKAGIDIQKFKRKTINFGTSSQDLYYSFNIAKDAIIYGGGVY